MTDIDIDTLGGAAASLLNSSTDQKGYAPCASVEVVEK